MDFHSTLSRLQINEDKPIRTSLIADDIIQHAIELHENMDLTTSTEHFKTAADLGSITGMCLYGIALRSGWGCDINPELAFEYFTRAADTAICSKSDYGEQELAVALYEMGHALKNGWGVRKCCQTGFFYLLMSADLGDSAAQIDVATCYMEGNGIKRNKLFAAKYFRMASLSGAKIPFSSWVWKQKYDSCGITKNKQC